MLSLRKSSLFFCILQPVRNRLHRGFVLFVVFRAFSFSFSFRGSLPRRYSYKLRKKPRESRASSKSPRSAHASLVVRGKSKRSRSSSTYYLAACSWYEYESGDAENRRKEGIPPVIRVYQYTARSVALAVRSTTNTLRSRKSLYV